VRPPDGGIAPSCPHGYRANVYEEQPSPRATGLPRSSDSFAEQRIEVGRYVETLRWTWPFIVLVALVATTSAFVTSTLTPKKYRATARVVIDDPLASSDESGMERRLATVQQLLTTRRVLEEAAKDVGGVSVAELKGSVRSGVDPDANIINVVATAGSPEAAAEIGNAVANSFIVEQVDVERERLARARVALLEELDQVAGVPERAAEAQAIRDRLSAIAVAEASVGTELALAEAAEPPSAPASPRPFRNSLLALFASVFLASLVVLGREQLRPRLSGPRELARVTNLPILVGIPRIGGFRGRRSVVRGMEREGYQSLQTMIAFQLPPTSVRTILLTGALHEEGKTRAAVGLARSLARTAHKTLLVSADMRWPTLHKAFDLPLAPGLAEVLSMPDQDVKAALESALAAVHAKPTRAYPERGLLEVLPSGEPPAEPAKLLGSPAMLRLFSAAGELGFQYVVIDAPPMIGLADSQILAQRVDGVLVVARIDRLDVDTALDLRETFDRLGVEPLGIVAVGVRAAISPYFLRPRLAASDR
jgi:Mrp family chromosome partitioning ATPase/capsular polysaccharide biosynthesis protein